jgi:hypothetical protein
MPVIRGFSDILIPLQNQPRSASTSADTDLLTVNRTRNQNRHSVKYIELRDAKQTRHTIDFEGRPSNVSA